MIAPFSNLTGVFRSYKGPFIFYGAKVGGGGVGSGGVSFESYFAKQCTIEVTNDRIRISRVTCFSAFVKDVVIITIML